MTKPPYLSEYQAGYVHRSGEKVRSFEGGATRDSDAGKLDFEGFLSPAVLWAFAEYMQKHRIQSDGSVRGSDNWQNGMPKSVYVKSLLRHVFDLWMLHRDEKPVRPENGEPAELADTLGGILFNLQGYWLETLREQA